MHRGYIPTRGEKLHLQNLHMMGLLMVRIHRLVVTPIRSEIFLEGRIKKVQSVSQQAALIMFIYFNCNENIQLIVSRLQIITESANTHHSRTWCTTTIRISISFSTSTLNMSAIRINLCSTSMRRILSMIFS